MVRVPSQPEAAARVAKAVKHIRVRSMLTQAEFAAGLKVSTNTVARWEAGRMPDGTSMKKLIVSALQLEDGDSFLVLLAARPDLAPTATLHHLSGALRQIATKDLPNLQVSLADHEAEGQVFEISRKIRDIVSLLDISIAPDKPAYPVEVVWQDQGPSTKGKAKPPQNT